MPALEKARKLQSKASKAGLLDRDRLADAVDGLVARLGESPNEAEFGQLLWEIVALAHRYDINAEDALRSYTGHARRQLVPLA